MTNEQRIEAIKELAKGLTAFELECLSGIFTFMAKREDRRVDLVARNLRAIQQDFNGDFYAWAQSRLNTSDNASKEQERAFLEPSSKV